MARGKWQEHPKFGKQFRAQSVTEKLPASPLAIQHYLSSGSIKGVGPALAKRIVDHFGLETKQILEDSPERLSEVPGLGKKKIEQIVAVWSAGKSDRETDLFLSELGLSPSISHRIRQRFGLRTIEAISEDPYQLVEEVWGIGFHRADEIGKALGIEPQSSQRIRAALLHELKKSADDGNCYLPRDILLKRVLTLLGIDDAELVLPVLATTVSEQLIVQDGENLSSRIVYEAEFITAARIAQFLKHLKEPEKRILPHLVEAVCSEAQVARDQLTGSPRVIHLSDQQREALRLTAENSLLVITGGPGCGKTTVLRSITELFRRAGLRIRLAAPTGRAAQRMAEVCGVEATTIHRLLKFDPATRGFVHSELDPIEADVVILDETSMVDIYLAAALLRAIPDRARIVFVGDADQLPSVGPGLFLSDLLSMPEIPSVHLTNLFRRSSESLISSIAHEVNSGSLPEIPEPDGVTKCDAYFMPIRDLAQGSQLIEKLVVDQIPKKFGFSGSQIAVLSPMNQGELGVVTLNQRLQARLVPAAPSLARVKIGAIELRLGDRVCQRVNNYTIIEGGVFNGEQGEIIGIDREAQTVVVKFWDGREITYQPEHIGQLDLAYAVSIHRAQGSESPAVVLVVHDSHSILLERQLIYTALTRAKKLLVIVGTKRALVLAVKKTRSKRRLTRLVERVKAATDGS